MNLATNVWSQPVLYSTANAHSHNDYEQAQPFFLAYQEKFGSIEADIHLVNGKILVAHDSKDVTVDKTLEKLYLDPLADFIKKNNGSPYSDPYRTLQLLIDQKTEAVSTLNALIQVLKKYPSIINNKKMFTVVVKDYNGNEIIRAQETSKKKAEQKSSMLALLKFGQLYSDQIVEDFD
jgi:alkaline phosphatase